MYQKGEIIPRDLKNAKECLYQNVNADDGRIYNELGRIMENEGNADDARKYYEKGARKYNSESMFIFGNILICDENDNNAEEGLNLIRLSKNQGYNQAEKYFFYEFD